MLTLLSRQVSAAIYPLNVACIQKMNCNSGNKAFRHGTIVTLMELVSLYKPISSKIFVRTLRVASELGMFPTHTVRALRLVSGLVEIPCLLDIRPCPLALMKRSIEQQSAIGYMGRVVNKTHPQSSSEIPGNDVGWTRIITARITQYLSPRYRQGS